MAKRKPGCSAWAFFQDRPNVQHLRTHEWTSFGESHIRVKHCWSDSEHMLIRTGYGEDRGTIVFQGTEAECEAFVAAEYRTSMDRLYAMKASPHAHVTGE